MNSNYIIIVMIILLNINHTIIAIFQYNSNNLRNYYMNDTLIETTTTTTTTTTTNNNNNNNYNYNNNNNNRVLINDVNMALKEKPEFFLIGTINIINYSYHRHHY